MISLQNIGYWGSEMPHKPSELSYVSQTRPPQEDHPHGIKAKARSFETMTILESAVPERSVVRKENYHRRLKQMQGEGFVSPIQKPYKAVGDPIHLDSKILISKALRLPIQDEDRLATANIEETHATPTGKQTPGHFRMRRTNKQLNTLKKETDHGRNLLKSVKLGHSLFKILQSEWSKRLKEKEAEQSEARGRISVKMAECNEESADHLAGFDGQLAYVPDLDATAVSNHRPYTPVHSNISKHVKPGGEALFKQLCALHWILKAMDIPDSSGMTPIIQCWELHSDRMGGEERLNRKTREDKLAREQVRYDNLFKKHRKVDPTTFRKPSKAEQRKIISGTKVRLSSVGLAQTSISHSESTDEEPTAKEQEKDNSSVNPTVTADSNQQTTRTQPTSKPEQCWQLTKEEQQRIDLTKQLEEAAKANNAPIERYTSKKYRAGGIIRAKSSPELIQFKKNCKSSELTKRPTELRMLWSEAKEEHSLRLHDDLDQHDKNRLRNCQNKFIAMTTSESGSGLYRALKNMRLRSEHMHKEIEKEKNKRQDQSKYAKWFEQLVASVPEEATKTWYYTRIIDKLRIYGIKYGPDEKTESASKASEHKFSRVIGLIRSWEICAPDIAAAIEFCREYIIEMNEQDFEDLLQFTFPAVERPSTAPAKAAGRH